MRKLLPFLFVTLFFIFFNAQANQTSQINAGSLEGLVKDYKKIYVTTKDIISNLVTENKRSKEEQRSNFSTDKLFSYTQQKKALNPNVGFKSLPTINWTSEVNYNFSPGFAEEDNIFYRARISSGLDWLVLGQGSEKNQKLENSIKAQSAQFDLLEKKQYLKQHSYTQTLNDLRAAFDTRRIKILSDYETILTLTNQLYTKQNKLALKNDGELAYKQHQLNKISIEKRSLQDLSDIHARNIFDSDLMQAPLPEIAPVEDLDLKHLVKDKKIALELQKEMIKINQKKDRQLDMRLKLRYNYYSTAVNDRNFASLGASINLPVTKSKSDIYDEASLQMRENELDNLQILYKDQLSDIYREYYELKAAIQILESESVYLESELKVRSENENSKTFSPAAYLDVAEKFLNNQLQLCEQKYNLLKKYSQYKMMSDTGSQDEPIFSSIDNTDNAGHETYIWSSLFNNYSNEYIITLLNHWHINRVFLSIGNVTNAAKVENFKALAAENNILVYRLIGENSYAATDDGFISLQNALINAKNAGFAGIHLDIEPHTFSDYKDNVDLYSQRLINLFTLSKIWCDQNNIALGVSVPMHLPTNVAYSLEQNNIMTYIMAYDVLSLDKKMAKTSVIRNILGSSLSVWVFRINDFENFSDLLNAETTVQNNNIPQIGYYDLSQMNNFKP